MIGGGAGGAGFPRTLSLQSDEVPVFEGKHYFLELFPTGTVEWGRVYPMILQVVSDISERVHDITPPVFQEVPNDVVVEAVGHEAEVRFPLPTAVDVVDPAPSVTCDPVSGTMLVVGATRIWCTATDADGNAADTTFMVTVLPDQTSPTVQRFELVPNRTNKNLQAVSVTFSEGMSGDQARALGNYVLATAGKDHKIGTTDDVKIPLKSASYDAVAHQVTLTPLKLPALNQVFQITVRDGVTDVVGNRLDGGPPSGAGGDFVAAKGIGTSFTLVVPDGDQVTLSSKGVRMELTLEPSGEMRELRLFGATSKASLTGSVKKPRIGGDGMATIPAIQGSAGVLMKLPLCSATKTTACFNVGSIAAMVIDRLLESGISVRELAPGD